MANGKMPAPAEASFWRDLQNGRATRTCRQCGGASKAPCGKPTNDPIGEYGA
jgi:hypothetical protein